MASNFGKPIWKAEQKTLKRQSGALPVRPAGPLAVTTVLAEEAPAWAVSGDGEPTGVDGLEGKLLLV